MKKTRRSRKQPEFERLPLSELRQGRRGKHHDLVKRIAGEMESLDEGEAMKIPLEDAGVTLSNLRSAVTRAMLARGVRIATFCDGKSLFLWKKTAGTARYERKRRQVGD